MKHRTEIVGLEGGTRQHRRLLVAVLALALAFGLGAVAPQFASAEVYRTPKVAGGVPVPDGKYPFMASMQFVRTGMSPAQNHFCGATLIDSYHVMTAAHCADNIDGVIGTGPVPASRLRIVVGKTVLSSTQGQTRGITGPSAVSIHPLYKPTGKAYDVAVIRLDRPVSGIAPIKLDILGSNVYENPGRYVRIAGWGSTSTGGQGAVVDRMREAQVPIVSDTTAKEIYKASYYPTLMVAAGKPKVDTCSGDSGGPLFVPVTGGYRQIGITSFGLSCGSYPGAYVEISASSIGNFVRTAQTR